MKLGCVLFMVGALSLTSCSRMDMAYSFGPRFVTNQIEEAFDLSSGRYKKIKEAITKNLKDNKSEFKTELITQIDALLKVADNKDLSEDEMKVFFNSGREMQTKLVYLLKPSFEEVLNSMSKDEFEHLKSYSQEKFKKTEEKVNDTEQLKKSSLEGFSKNMNLFFDSATDEQKKLYTDFIGQNQDYYRFQLEVRKSFMIKLESLFETKPEMLNYALKYYSGDASIKSDEQKKKQEIFFQNMLTAARAIWHSLSDKQHSEFKKTLNSMRADLEKL